MEPKILEEIHAHYKQDVIDFNWEPIRKQPNVVRPTLLYIISQAVIPAKAGIQLKRLDSGSSPE